MGDVLSSQRQSKELTLLFPSFIAEEKKKMNLTTLKTNSLSFVKGSVMCKM